jgi:hypothetical protein
VNLDRLIDTCGWLRSYFPAKVCVFISSLDRLALHLLEMALTLPFFFAFVIWFML